MIGSLNVIHINGFDNFPCKKPKIFLCHRVTKDNDKNIVSKMSKMTGKIVQNILIYIFNPIKFINDQYSFQIILSWKNWARDKVDVTGRNIKAAKKDTIGKIV